METRKEIAAEKKRCGSHNCTQTVVCTYHDYTGIDEDTLKNVGNAMRQNSSKNSWKRQDKPYTWLI